MGSHASRAADEARQILESLRRLVRFLRLGARKAESQTGTSSAQLFVLQQLADAPAASLAELAARTLTDASSVSTVVARLVEADLVARRRAAGDARRVELALTRKGRAVIDRAPALAQTRIVDALAKMAPAERRALATSLGRMIDAIGAADLPPRMLFEDEAPARGRRRGR